MNKINYYDIGKQEPKEKTYYFIRSDKDEKQDNNQRGTGGTIDMFTYWSDCDFNVIKDMLRHAATSDPSIGRDQQDEYGIYYDARNVK